MIQGTNKNNVTVAIGGGLGNQLFQYAMGRALAARLDAELQLDVLELLDPAKRRNAARRTYDLSIVFSIDPELVVPARFFQAVPIPYIPAILGKVYSKMLAKVGHWKYYRQSGFINFEPEVLHLTGNVYLHGGWQSDKYFKDQEAVIRKDLIFRDVLGGDVKTLQQEIHRTKSVALHVRRGDKMWNPIALKSNIVAPQSYYDEAITLMKTKIGDDIKVYIFSDDVLWCTQNLRIDADHMVVPDEFSGPRGGWHLQLMASCKHFIIPESTFSWWGAWLGKNPDKIVIAPKRMFQDESIDTKDAYPKTWIRI